jgi:CrcB protein
MVNVLGSALVGICYVLIIEKGAWAPEWRHVLMIGFLGAFTTFSTFSLDALNMWQNGHQTLAFVYAAITFAASLAAVVASVEITQRLV